MMIVFIIQYKIQKNFKMSNFRTLGDLNKDKDKDDKKKQTSSYTGGESSGMAVINPDVDSLVQKADKNEQTPEQYSKSQKKKGQSVCKITLYQNGFMIDDEEYYDYNDPQQKNFMKQLNSGLIPKKLRQKYPKGGLSISLSDKRTEKYTPPPPPPYVAFSGSGTSLSDPVKPANKFAKKKGAQENFILEPNRKKQITTIQVRLLDGQRISIEVNLDTNLHDIFNHVATVSGVSHFELFGGFPPKPLNLDTTVEQSDLADSTLIQKA